MRKTLSLANIVIVAAIATFGFCAVTLVAKQILFYREMQISGSSLSALAIASFIHAPFCYPAIMHALKPSSDYKIFSLSAWSGLVLFVTASLILMPDGIYQKEAGHLIQNSEGYTVFGAVYYFILTPEGVLAAISTCLLIVGRVKA